MIVIGNIFKFIFKFILIIFRMLLIGGASATLVVFEVDKFTKSQYGANNLIIIICSLVFVPLFVSLFVEFLLYERRKKKNKKEDDYVEY